MLLMMMMMMTMMMMVMTPDPPVTRPFCRYSLATDICLAALTGEGVFNFGEVLATPILQVMIMVVMMVMMVMMMMMMMILVEPSGAEPDAERVAVANAACLRRGRCRPFRRDRGAEP
jgi:hypothetical protein